MADEGVLLGDLDCSQCLEGAEILFTLQRVISTARADKLPLCILKKKKNVFPNLKLTKKIRPDLLLCRNPMGMNKTSCFHT